MTKFTFRFSSPEWTRIWKWGARLFEFGLIQGIVQILTAISGILIVRTLSKQEYALFAIANSMQTTCNLLADVGIGIGVRSIGGRVWNDRLRLGQLLTTTLKLRQLFAAFSLLVTLPITSWMLIQNGANWQTTALLCATVALSVIPLLGITAWKTCTQLHGEVRRIQKLDFSTAILRLFLISAISLSKLNALLAMFVGLITNWIQMVCFRRWAGEKISPGSPPNDDDRKELLSLSRKWLPNVVFFCFQGQITLLILSYFGNSSGLADVTALSRVSALLTILSITFGNVLAPRFARCQSRARLGRLYILLVGGTGAILVPLFVLGTILPKPFLWLLGSSYRSLESELIWVLAAGCVTQFAGVMLTLNSTKGWIRLQSLVYIPSIIGTQLIAASILDLRQFHDLLIFNLATAIAPLPVYLADAYLGIKSMPHLSPPPPTPKS